MSTVFQEANVGSPAIDDASYAFFQRHVLKLTGIDLTAYKSQQMRRRLGTMMARTRTTSLFEYAKLLEKPERLQEFLDFFTINVSEFFRIPEKFDYLQKRVMPALMDGRNEVRIWSAGCSNGAEPYSLAIMMDEIAPAGRWSVLGTDVDRTILSRAQRGDQYTEADLRNVSPARLTKYFERDGATYRVKSSLKSRVRFQAHDLLKDGFQSGFKLILCRHVVIYFTEEAKDVLYRKFCQSLDDAGVLFVGGTEILPHASAIGFESMAVAFYRKATSTAKLSGFGDWRR